MTTYYRWIQKGPDLQKARAKTMQAFASSRAAYWIFDMADRWKPSAGVSADRVLVTIIFNERGEAIIKDQSKWIKFPGSAFLGEAQHPDKIIVKSNEPGAYGVGQSLLKELNNCVKETRPADLREIAKALGKGTAQVQGRMKLQKWD